jgi:UDPglucose--hexose-1-phosphate uridylyltransferase
MAKATTRYVCQSCGAVFPKWMGKCTTCSAWDSLSEETVAPTTRAPDRGRKALPASQLMATTFVPRRVLYELRAGREYFSQKERCVFCDILSQEERQAVRVVESIGDYVAVCPYAPRVPFETWLLPRVHESAFERAAGAKAGLLYDFAKLLRRTLQRVLSVANDFHLVLHTSPNTLHRSVVLGYWRTIDEDYHWHIEILPIMAERVKSYSAKETYFTPVSSETAAARLREAKVE